MNPQDYQFEYELNGFKSYAAIMHNGGTVIHVFHTRLGWAVWDYTSDFPVTTFHPTFRSAIRRLTRKMIDWNGGK